VQTGGHPQCPEPPQSASPTEDDLADGHGRCPVENGSARAATRGAGAGRTRQPPRPRAPELRVTSQGVTTIVALNAGTIAAAGPPAAVLTGDVFREVFAAGGSLIPDPVDGRPRVLLRGWNSTPAPGELATDSRPGR
jgi:hypothetical protein